eukprot:m.7487 g.7487  ORF g.7487 m.7487 type:complete len:51 (+) comp18785_c0_seq1:784-936(+)
MQQDFSTAFTGAISAESYAKRMFSCCSQLLMPAICSLEIKMAGFGLGFKI